LTHRSGNGKLTHIDWTSVTKPQNIPRPFRVLAVQRQSMSKTNGARFLTKNIFDGTRH